MIDLRLGDYLEIMPTLAAQSYDVIIADIPYGTTACKWDTVIPFAPMWAELKRLAKPKAAIVLFGSQPFTSALVMSNAEWFRYEWVWEKTHISGYLNSKKRPLVATESVCVFSENGHTYNPQGLIKGKFNNSRPAKAKRIAPGEMTYGVEREHGLSEFTNYPKNILKIANNVNGNVHPTQKPVALMEYLIRTYTNEGDAVLDFTMGSGTTMVACVNTKRNGTGIEKDAGYFAIAQRRIQEAQAQLAMPMVIPCPS